MSLWEKLLERLQSFQLDLVKRFRPEHPTSSVEFSIGVIALAAKLAKADGRVDRSEVAMFRSIMDIPPHEEKNAARVYNLCRMETAGYEHYAKRIHRLISNHQDEHHIRKNLLDALFHIAMADGKMHPEQERFIVRVGSILEVPDEIMRNLRARHLPDDWNPRSVLGVPEDASEEIIRKSWKTLVRENHPDILASKGLPPEMFRISEARIRDINRAYEELVLQPALEL